MDIEPRRRSFLKIILQSAPPSLRPFLDWSWPLATRWPRRARHWRQTAGWQCRWADARL